MWPGDHPDCAWRHITGLRSLRGADAVYGELLPAKGDKKLNKFSILDGNLGHADVRGAVCRVLYRHPTIASSAVALVLASAGARAQQASDPAQPSASSGGIEEIVVTAQRRSESLQNVPYNISAIAGDALRAAGAVSLNNLSQYVPGLAN